MDEATSRIEKEIVKCEQDNWKERDELQKVYEKEIVFIQTKRSVEKTNDKVYSQRKRI